MKHLSNIKPGDLVRIYDYTHKRRKAMRVLDSDPNRRGHLHPHLDYDRIDSHKVGLIVKEYPEDSYYPDDYEEYGGREPDHDREWYVIPIGEEARGSTSQIIVHENRLERMVKQ